VRQVPDPRTGLTHLRFEVMDTGPGIPEKICQRLFQKFTQADSSITRQYGGTGLGLAICRQLVELMGGSIGVTSQVGVGSTFWFQVPLARSSNLLPDVASLPLHLKKLKVLLVDDLPMNLEILSRQLSALGVKVTTVEDGFAAVGELERAWHRGKPYDIMFLDQMMPGMSGEELAERVRSNPLVRETKLVLVSSSGQHGVKPSKAALMDARVDKPVRQHELLDCLTRVYSAAAPEAHTLHTSAGSEPSTSRAIPLKILVAEDNKINQKFALALLESAGHHVTIVENGHQAVDAVGRTDYDVILMDVQMPGLDGICATREIRAMPPTKGRIPIIALTANAMAGAEVEYLQAGMDDYVPKPIQPSLLFAKLARLAASIKAANLAISRPIETSSSAMIADDDTAPIFDLESLAGLETVLPRETIREILSLYNTETDAVLHGIEQSIVAGDWASASRHAHMIIGSAGNIGAARVSQLARRLESSCNRKDGAGARHFAAALSAASVATSQAIRNKIAEMDDQTPIAVIRA
jgi:CheY-like chemotaxis protein/HPt (histidine-containing phosphotransfer) domain-containing protein